MTVPRPDDTPPQYRPAIRHRGSCGPRRPCYRSACRERFGAYATVELLPDRVMAYCHGSIQPVDSVILGMLAG
jgi:hypothetical protein